MPAFVKAILPIIKFQQAVGTTSVIAPVIVNKKTLLSYNYTEKEINDLLIFAGFSMNDTVLEQIANSSEFINQTMDLPFPESVPYFKVISKQTNETEFKQLKKVNMTSQAYQHKHLERIGKHAKYEILNGTHFIYLNSVDRISEITNDLLLSANQ